MRQFITIVLLILLPLCANADNSQLYQKLDAALAKRAHYVEVKGTERSVYNDLHPKISQSLWNIISYTDVAQRAPQNETFTWV